MTIDFYQYEPENPNFGHRPRRPVHAYNKPMMKGSQ
jgi:hypothetical protein